MHAWIMFLWLTGGGITTQEFNTRKECVQSAIALRAQFGKSFGFICIEKGKK